MHGFTEGVLLCGERTDDDDGLAGLLLRDPLVVGHDVEPLRLVAPLRDDDGRLRFVFLLPDLDGFAVVCARELNELSIDF